jgi:hypothetical protein
MGVNAGVGGVAVLGAGVGVTGAFGATEGVATGADPVGETHSDFTQTRSPLQSLSVAQPPLAGAPQPHKIKNKTLRQAQNTAFMASPPDKNFFELMPMLSLFLILHKPGLWLCIFLKSSLSK